MTALAPPTDAERSRTVPTARDAEPSRALERRIRVRSRSIREKLEEAYRALDDAYAQIRSLQTAQSQVASRGDGDRRSPNTTTTIVNEVLDQRKSDDD